MKSEKTYCGLTLESYNQGDYITLYVSGTHDINEDYYNVVVNAEEDGKGNVVVETTDNHGYEYDNVVRTAIVQLSHYNILFDEPNISPKKAQDLLYSVRKDLDRLIALGESYAHFQSAQATHKYLKKAKKNLEGLN